jgi:hypothetical protein
MSALNDLIDILQAFTLQNTLKYYSFGESLLSIAAFRPV